MTRHTIDIDQPVEYLSILDEGGEVDAELEPDVPGDLLVAGLKTMLLARRFDERRLKLQRSGRIGTFAPVNGQEAAQVGSIAALRADDWFVPSYRETAANFWRGVDAAHMLAFDAGYNEGVAIPEDARNLPNAVPVGTQMLQAAGIAYAARRRGTDEVAMTYFGDGATSQGDFHEALNFASVFDCPVVFVCQNNQYAISVPREKQTRAATIAQKAIAYGMPGIQIDGNDVLAAYVAASEAVKRAREEARPTLIECVTYRLEMHTTADDPTRYRTDEEVEEWRSRDPIERFAGYLAAKDLIDDAKRDSLEDEVETAIDEAWRKAEDLIGQAAGPTRMFEHILAEKTPELQRQQERFAAIWDAQQKDGGDD